MSKQPQNNKGTAVLGSLVFMALYALGIWHNAVRGKYSLPHSLECPTPC